MLILRLFTDPVGFLIIAIALIYGLTIHEYFHGWVAYILGDDTAKLMGRLSVNPMVHFDPILTTMALFFGIGAAKPVPINPYRLKYGKNGVLLVSIAGIIANFVSALIFALLFKILYESGAYAHTNLVFSLLSELIMINLVLMVFNLIPLPPLDGSKVLLMIAPAYEKWYKIFTVNQILSIFVAIMLFSYFGGSLITFFARIVDFIIF